MRLAAFSDPHIGSYGTKMDPEIGLNARYLDTLDTLGWIVKDAARRDIEGILFGGDMFRHSKPSPTELYGVRMALSAEKVRYVAIPGNHDQPRGKNEKNALMPLHGEQFFVASEPTVVRFNGVQVATLPYPSRSQLAASIPGYAEMSPAEVDEKISEYLQSTMLSLVAKLEPGPSVLLAHLSIDLAEPGTERGIMVGRDITVPLSSIPREFTFAVFGHIHKPQGFSKHGRPNVLHMGSTERIDFGEEDQKKYYCILDFDAGTWVPVEIPCRRYHTFQIDLTAPGFDLKDIVTADGTNEIVRVKLKRPAEVKPDYEAIRKRIMGAEPFDFRGYVEEVERTAGVRCAEVDQATSIEALMSVWHSSVDCRVPLESLLSVAREIENESGSVR